MSEVVSHSIPFNFHMGLDSKAETEVDSGSEDPSRTRRQTKRIRDPA